MSSKRTKLNFTFAVHDFHRRGGHERSNLELLRRLRKKFKIEAFAYELEHEEDFDDVEFSEVKPRIHKPDSLKIFYFLLVSFYKFCLLPRFRGEKRSRILSTGTASCVSDIVQVQFVNARWKRSAVFPENAWGTYQKVLLAFHILVERIVYRPEKKYIAISNSVREELEEEFQLKNIDVIHHGVDTKDFRPVAASDGESIRGLRKEFRVAEGRIVILFVGAYERKGLASAIEGFAGIPGPLLANACLIAVGGGNREFYRQIAKNYNVESKVILLPNRADIAEIYRMSDIFLLPTRYEPFGLVVLEAMASGLPVVVSASAGAAELIEDGVNGQLLKDPKNGQEISLALARLIEDQGLRIKLGEAARATALQHDWDIVADAYAALIG